MGYCGFCHSIGAVPRLGTARVLRAAHALSIAGMCMATCLAAPAAGDAPGGADGRSSSGDTYRIAGISPTEALPGGRSGAGVYRWLVLPDRLLASASPDPPLPVFRQSFTTLARSAIAAKWLPERLDDAEFAAVGEGAFRARTARMFKIYDRHGARVILQGFAGRVVLIVKPSPLSLPPEGESLIRRTAPATEPWGVAQPYAHQAVGPDPSIEAIFRAIRQDVLAPGAQPVNEDRWKASLRRIAVKDDWLWVAYACKPLNDPGVRKPSGSRVDLWTNGKVLWVTAQSVGDPEIELEHSPLFRALRPTVKVTVELLPGVSGVATLNEWTDPNRVAVPIQAEATHQWFYIRLGKHRLYTAWVPLAQRDARLRDAQWAALAAEARMRADYMGSLLDNTPRIQRVIQSRGRREALEWLTEQRQQTMDAIESLRQLPCPACFAELREKMLEAMSAAPAIWQIGLAKWREALTKPAHVAADYQAVGESVRLSLREKRRQANRPAMEADRGFHKALAAIGIFVDEDIYTHL